MDITCETCIVGGGPAGMMLGLLLARDGVDVVVLEKHADFLRDFRGDTVHPSTLDVLDALGLGGALAKLPHRDVSQLQVTFSDGTYQVADFRRLRIAHPYIRFMPQWDFLNVLAEAAEALPNFRLLRGHEVTDVLRDGVAVNGVAASTSEGTVRVRALLTVAADGRGSVVRERTQLPVRRFAAPMDVLWFRVSRVAGDEEGLDMHVGSGRLALAIDRGDYWQVAYVVRKGADQALRDGDIDVLRRLMAELIPVLGSRMTEIRDWADVKTLTVQLDRLHRWHDSGVLCIGDAAHAMSPIGGVGINLAVQDAVAAARILSRRQHAGSPDTKTLAAIQRRRWLPTAGTQLVQRLGQRFLVERALRSTGPVAAPAPVRVLSRLPVLQALIARMVGVGLRPESLASHNAGPTQ